MTLVNRNLISYQKQFDIVYQWEVSFVHPSADIEISLLKTVFFRKNNLMRLILKQSLTKFEGKETKFEQRQKRDTAEPSLLPEDKTEKPKKSSSK